jgi:hypothetical protein
VDILQCSREKLRHVCAESGLSLDLSMAVRCLTPDEAIGQHADSEFVIKKGLESMVEADFDGARGQAFTDHPGNWQGTLDELLNLNLTDIRQRAIFTAGLNAVMRRIGHAQGTIHCLNEEPKRCGEELARQMRARFGSCRYGLIGLQPAILKGLTEEFGTQGVRVLDLNPDNIGQIRSGVPIWDGEKDLQRLIDWCDVGLATGSSIVNGSLNHLLARFRAVSKPLAFFGNTIAGTAVLNNLLRVCPFAA